MVFRQLQTEKVRIDCLDSKLILLVAILLDAGQFYIDENRETLNIGVEPLNIPSKKSILNIMVDKIKFIGDKAAEELDIFPDPDEREKILVYLMTPNSGYDEIFEEIER